MSKPTANPNNILFKIAHPDLYERNPFNILNLPVNATARDIRRRKEDIEAAFDAGTVAEIFADIIPDDEKRMAPTREEVEEAFAALEDPERRIAYALFWFWPEPNTSMARNSNESIIQWLNSLDESFPGRSFSDSAPYLLREVHNFAVFSHLMALGYERSLLRDKEWKGATPDEVRQHWKFAVSFWNATVGDTETWHEVSTLVKALDDPRLDYHFTRALRDQFAFAFDQINAELAIDFARQGREVDAGRQVEYMALSQPDVDDVEGTFDDAFAGLLRQVESVVGAVLKDIADNPQEGLSLAKAILTQTDEPLRISRIVFKRGNPIRELIATKIFSGVRQCLIAYGNSTNDWEGCLRVTQRLDCLAETVDQRELLAKDRHILRQNKEAKILHRVEALSTAAGEDSSRRPLAGLRHAEKLLLQSQEWLDSARDSLPEGSQLRTAIVDTVISGVRGCIAKYGKATGDWIGCLQMVSRLQEIAETAEQMEMLAQDEHSFAQKKREKELKETCWVCKTNKAEAQCAFKVPMYGKVRRNVVHGQILWRKYVLSIPRCSRCMKARRNWLVLIVFLLVAFLGLPTILGAVRAYHSNGTSVLEGGAIGLFVGMMMLWGVLKMFRLEQNERTAPPNYRDYPDYIELTKAGWRQGSHPPDVK